MTRDEEPVRYEFELQLCASVFVPLCDWDAGLSMSRFRHRETTKLSERNRKLISEQIERKD